MYTFLEIIRNHEKLREIREMKSREIMRNKRNQMEIIRNQKNQKEINDILTIDNF